MNKPQKCKWCGIINSEKRPVKNYACEKCRQLKKEYPKEVVCFICDKIMTMTFKSWSRRGNMCEECDSWITRKVKMSGYPILPQNRKEMEKYLFS